MTWLTEGFIRSGVQASLGLRLWQVLTRAGLRPLGMMGVQPYFGPGDPTGAALLADLVRSAAPLMERTQGQERRGTAGGSLAQCGMPYTTVTWAPW
jgi:hypothetical protein